MIADFTYAFNVNLGGVYLRLLEELTLFSLLQIALLTLFLRSVKKFGELLVFLLVPGLGLYKYLFDVSPKNFTLASIVFGLADSL